MRDEERPAPSTPEPLTIGPPAPAPELRYHPAPRADDLSSPVRLPIEMMEPPSRFRGHLAWLLTLAVGLLAFRFLVPYFAEQIAYSINRGTQRAQWENAGDRLQTVSLRELSHDSELIWQRIGPSVVHISVRGAASESTPRGMPADPFHRPERFFPQGQGSGIVVAADGYILTNFHVVDGAEEVDVHLSDGRHEQARVIGADELTDLALVKVSATNLIPAEWGDSETLEVGAAVWAVGSPFGLERSLSFGILSGKNRSGFAGGNPHQDFLQTDVAVNPGNSGGPLVNVDGRVVGINTAIIGTTYQGISFAIPSNVARDVYEKLKATGQVQRGWLGVKLNDVSPQLAKEVGLPSPKGALISEVVDDGEHPGPAKEAGVLPGDIVLSWNGKEIGSTSVLMRLVAATPIGEAVDLVIWREGQELTLKITVAERPGKIR